MVYFPQINANLILTQVPYGTSLEFENIDVPVETGMVWSYPLRGAGLSGYPSGSLGKFNVNFSNISDAEVNLLYTFFQSVRGKWGSFRFLDPSGNLLSYSQDFTNAAWVKTLTVTTGQPDPSGHTLGCSLTAGHMQSIAGPSDGGLSGFVMCASIWLKAVSGSVAATIGFIDETTSTAYTQQFTVASGAWTRISKNLVLPTNNQFVFYLNLSGSAYGFGAQVSPMKGEGAYACTPGAYGYHANCRFDTDVFNIQAVGPNQNQLQLPVVETN